MQKSESIAALATALAAAHQEFRPLTKSRTVKVRTKDGTQYEFSYAPLDELFDATSSALSKHGVSIVQMVGRDPTGSAKDNAMGITTMLLHKSGEHLSEFLPILGVPRGPQDLGSHITYLRRYALQAMLGLAAEDDDDANAAHGNEVQERRDRAPRQAPPPPPRRQEAPRKREPLPLDRPPPEQPRSEKPEWRRVSAEAHQHADPTCVDGFPVWFGEPVPIGRPKKEGYTWGDMVNGSPDGQRASWLRWAATELDPYTQADGKPTPGRYVLGQETIVARAQACIEFMEDTDGDAPLHSEDTLEDMMKDAPF